MADLTRGTYGRRRSGSNSGPAQNRILRCVPLCSLRLSTTPSAASSIFLAQDVQLQDAQQWITTQRRHAVAAKLRGTLPRSHTSWIASYRWVNGPALTPVDMFNASPGQSDPYLNLFIRQPIPSMGFLPGHMEAIIDLRNLLAQGYVPVLGQDGQTVYLVQSARAIRGGVTFTF